MCEGTDSEEAYHKFADENLAGEDTYFVAPDIFKQFWSEFHFTGYPSYIEVLPDGRVNLNTRVRLIPEFGVDYFMKNLSK